jgi:hypothetical protein
VAVCGVSNVAALLLRFCRGVVPTALHFLALPPLSKTAKIYDASNHLPAKKSGIFGRCCHGGHQSQASSPRPPDSATRPLRFGHRPFAADRAFPAAVLGPVLLPPCRWQRPLGNIAIRLQTVPCRVRAPQRNLNKSAGSSGNRGTGIVSPYLARQEMAYRRCAFCQAPRRRRCSAVHGERDGGWPMGWRNLIV